MEHGRDVLAYALRRARNPDDAAEVLAETFLIAWRRIGDVPADSAARLWLFGVARRVFANHRRGESRREHLTEHLAADLRLALEAHGGEQHDPELLIALDALAPADREILTLVTWDDLSLSEAASHLGISTIAARSRIHRARRRLRHALDTDQGSSSPKREEPK